jgi:type I restriction enzyme, S subunit
MESKEYKLKEVVKIIDGDRGKNYPSRRNFLEKGYCLFLNAKNFSDNKLDFSSKQFITKERDQLLGGGKVEHGDLILTTRGTIGLIAQFDNSCKYKNVRINSGMVILRPKSNLVDENYLYYALISYNSQYQIKNLSSGSAQPQLPIKDLQTIHISLPPLPEQKRIANILSSFDNKIELLREQNKTLENIAQTIFKQWFVDFNFPDSNGKPYKDNGGKMIDSELGLIPEGWEVISLKELISLQSGFAHNTKLTGETKAKIAKMGVVDGKSLFNKSSVINYPGKIDNKYKLNQGDLLICTRDVTRDKIIIGNVAMIPEDLAQSGLYAGSNTWIIKTDFNKNFLFLLFKSLPFREHIIRSSKGSTIVMITQDSFLNYDLCLPKKDIMNNVNKVTNCLFKKIQTNTNQILNYQKLKSSLINKLIY